MNEWSPSRATPVVPRSAPPRSTPPRVPPPAGAPLWLRPLVLGGAIAGIVLVAVLLLLLPDRTPPDELTHEELAALIAAPPERDDLPPLWATPTRPADLQLTTDPAGAAVQLNNEWVGTTPIRLDAVHPGFYTIRLAKPDHVSKDTSFYLASGAFIHLDVRLDAEPPASEPFAPEIAGSTQRPSAAPASRRIQQEGRPAGGGTPTTEFDVATPEQVRRASHTGSLSVTSNPPGAIVLIDGVVFGRAPLSLSDLQPGTYVVTLTLPGVVPVSYRAEVAAQSVSVIKGVFPPPSDN